jgi:hypothetical protein
VTQRRSPRSAVASVEEATVFVVDDEEFAGGKLDPTASEAPRFKSRNISAAIAADVKCAWLEVIGYNTNLVAREDAPKSYTDLLDPKWQGKLVKGHPGCKSNRPLIRRKGGDRRARGHGRW